MAFENRWRRQPPRAISQRMAQRIKEYNKRKRRFLKHKLTCDCEGCLAKPVDVHHTRGRAGLLLNDERYWMAMCRMHHDWSHQWPDQARRLGWLAPLGKWGKAD